MPRNRGFRARLPGVDRCWTAPARAVIHRLRAVGAAQVAQLVEQWTENPRVGGSNPPLGTIPFQVLSSAAAENPGHPGRLSAPLRSAEIQIGRASCRERVCQYV